jgi:glyceraldehyde-3-phosphate dehydrogenase (NADP+)
MSKLEWRVTEYPLLVGGEWIMTPDPLKVTFPYDGTDVGFVALAGEEHIQKAMEKARRGFYQTRGLSGYMKHQILMKLRDQLVKNKEDLAATICLEAGKPLGQARAEVARAAFTVETAAEEARRVGGEVLPLDRVPWAEGKHGVVARFPRGIVVGITPFNFPLNLVAHKLAPAMAAGCPFILKPSSKTPIAAWKLMQMVLDAGYPEEAVSYLPMVSSRAEKLYTHPDAAFVSFTGSAETGWEVKRRAFEKFVTLELGGNAAVVVHEDAGLDVAAVKCATGGMAYAGQSCISVQRILVHASVYAEFTAKLLADVAKLKVGDPRDEETFIGPMIDTGAVKRIEGWIDEAVEKGCNLLTPRRREGKVLHPVVLEGARPGMKVWDEEAFAPLVTITPFSDFREAVELVNASRFGLQAALFTNRADCIMEAFKEIHVGGLVVNDASSFRVDHQPYGGVKQSGTGKEGVRWAINEMTEEKILIYQS